MADYKINISVDDKDSGRKVDELDKKLKEVTKPKKINIEFPNFNKVKQDLQDLSKYNGIAVQAFKQFTPIGKQFAALEGNVKVVGDSLVNVGRTLQGLSAYANPVRGIADGFGAVTQSIDAAIRTTANLGFAIFGVTQSVNILRAAFGQAFEDTVGREIKLRESILQTATTLAGTNRIFAEGFEIKDPTQKLQALEGSVSKSIERIRERSLEVAGTTSAAMIQTFSIVASQIGSFGGTMQQAEDLAVKFSGALGTLGMSDPGYARQEIGSIMMANIGQDSVLAKTIGISNPDIQRARQQGKVYEYLSEKLAIFEAGQKKQAKGFAGITSNIQELQEELKRSFGASLLDPILKRIESFYDKVGGKDTIKTLKATAQAFGQLIGGSLNSAYGTVTGASILKGIDAEKIQEIAKKLQEVFAKVALYIQEQLARVAPAVQRIVDQVGKSVVVLGKAFAEMAGTLGRIKIDQLVVRLQTLSALTPGILAAANAYAEYLKTIEDIANTPLGRYINELKEMRKILSEFGVFGIVNNIIAIRELKQQIPALVTQIQTIGASIGQSAQSTFAFVAGLYNQIATATVRTIAAVEGPIIGTFSKISLGIARVAAQAAQFTLTLSNAVVILGGQLATLSAPLASLANGLAGIAVSLSKAGLNAAQFGAEVQAAMTRAQTSTQNATSSINALGVRLKAGVQAGATAAAGALTGLVKGFLATLSTMALWTAGLTLLFDTIRRVGEWWERFSQQQSYKQAIDDLNNGLLSQVKAANAAGKALDSVTEARKRLREETLQAQISQDESALKELAKELYKRTENIKALRRNFSPGSPGATGPDSKLSDEKFVLKRDPGFAKELKEVEERLKNANKLLRQLRGETDSTDKNDPQLKQQENRQAIEELAKFEKDTRRAIEDEIYNYRRQAQDKELQIWRQQGEQRIQRLASENQLMIDGVNSEARASLEALNNWLSSKRRGELDIEAKKREAQMAAADLERALGKFRLNLEQQVAELRKRAGQYEFELLDKRIKAEQLIANIRNGSIVWESPENGQAGAGTGQFRVGSTGRSSGPHLHIGGTSTEEVIQDAMTIIKAWQKMGVEYIKLSNVGADVKNVTDDNKLRSLIRQEMAVHGRRSRNNPVDIAVPSGTPLPVPHGPVTWGGAAEGFMSRSTRNGNFYLHGLKPEGGGGSAPAAGSSLASRQNAAMQFFMSKGLTRVQAAALVGGFMQESSGLDPSKVNPSTGAEGIAQWKDSRKTAMIQAGARNSFQKQLNFVWQELMSSENNAYVDLKNSKTLNEALMAAARYERFRGYQQLGGGEWGNRAAYTKQLLASGAGRAGASATAGGAPNMGPVTLQTDTSPIEAAQGRLNTLNQDLIELGKDQNALNSEEGFRAFIKSLDTTSADLERINKQVRDQTIDLTAVTEATKGGIYDPETLQADIRYQQGLATLDAVRKTSLETLAKFGNITAEERARAEAGIGQAYEDNKKRLLESLKLEKQRLDIDKERQRLLDLNAARRQAQGDLLQQTFQLQSEARSARFAPDDFASIRREQALQALETERLRLTENDTKPLSEATKASFEELRKQLLANADALAKLDRAVNESRRIRELTNATEQSRIDRLTSEGAARTEAAKAALDPTNFRAQRRLDAQQTITSRYLELTKGGTQALTDGEAQELQRLAEQALISADALAKVDTELQRFADRLTLARDSARAVTDGYKGMISSLMSGGSLSEAVSEMGQNIAGRFTEKIMDYAFRPMEQQLEEVFRKFFGANDAQSKNTDALTSLTTRVEELTTAITTAKTTASTPEAATGQATGELATGLQKNAKGVGDATDKTLTNLQRYTSGLASVATTALALAGGIELMGKGGTRNTLLGLASIFGSISSFSGMFTKGGIFGARALGGPVVSRQPYLVGERGPELFIPENGGKVVNNGATAALMASRNALGGSGAPPEDAAFTDTRDALGSASGNAFNAARSALEATTTVLRERQTERVLAATLNAPPKPMDITYEAQVINSVEYVTADQFRRGLSDAAERGRAMTLGSLRNSVKTRRQVGI